MHIINSLIDRVARSGNDGVIPWVWGGSSFVQPYQDGAFYQIADGTWHRDGKNDPYNGFDCSEFVMRIAQIAGIDFPWKNTKVIGCSLRAFNEQDCLEEGDLIWVHGHVMIVSNIERNEIIEARNYTSGYGCVHRIALSDCIDGMVTYADLINAYCDKQPIRFKNKQGVPEEKWREFRLLKLPD